MLKEEKNRCILRSLTVKDKPSKKATKTTSIKWEAKRMRKHTNYIFLRRCKRSNEQCNYILVYFETYKKYFK